MKDFSVDTLRQTVIQSYSKKDWNRCVEACIELRKRFPGNRTISMKLAEVYDLMGQNDEAVKVYLEMSEIFIKSGDRLNAISILKTAQSLAPLDGDIKKSLERLCAPEKGEKSERVLPNIPLLSDLNEDELIEVVASLKPLSFNVSDMVCREGEEDDSLFIITRGSVKVYVEGVAGEKMEIARLGEGEFFGEVGFFTDGRRHASVMALDETDLLEIQKEDIEKISKRYKRIGEILEDFYRRRVLDKLLVVSPLFGTLKEEDRRELLDRFEHKTFRQGDTVIREGEAGKSMFVIKNGRVNVSTAELTESEVSLDQLKEGDFFGEGAVITGKPRTATITALTPLEVMELSKVNLMAYLEKYPRIGEVLQRYLKTRADRTVNRLLALKDMHVKEGLV